MGTHNIESKLVIPGIGQAIKFSNGVPADGGIGFAPGCLCIDYSNGGWYRNTGTKESATWVLHEQFLAASMASAIASVSEVKDESGNIIFLATTNTTPALAAGYAKGCILLQTDTGTFKINTGTNASCTFTEKVWSDPA